MPPLPADDTLSTLAASLRSLQAEVHAGGDAILNGWRPHLHRADFAPGAANLADYLALRRHDLGGLQDRLARRGLSSLGRAESRIRPALAALVATLDRMEGRAADWPAEAGFDAGFDAGLHRIAAAQEAFFGPHPVPHATRIMVTLPSDAAEDPALVAALIDAGAGCLRINCAHDDAQAWGRMIGHVRATEARTGRHCPVIMDLGGPKIRIAEIHAPRPRLYRGDRFRLVQDPDDLRGKLPAMTLSHPHLLARLSPGDPVLIDDGRIVARVTAREGDILTLDVTAAPAKGVKLRPEKGVNFPGQQIDLPALTAEDRADLDFVARHADAVGFSFVQRPSDLDLLFAAMAERLGDAPPLPVLLKIETPLAVRNLPRLLVAAGGRAPVAVMIARGDLANEVGPARLSEVQEEILWLCEAAHVPVVWATQVLETLVKEGVPTRAEITDAAMGQRAECVMLNKGPFAAEGVAFLAGILRRMDRHQFKKSARLSPLTSWRDDQGL